ncbi:MAG: HAMP domain-containing protein, partial [Hyphomicrobiales bacterium]|nr:HAMP domain-containing protein [Hyphomicrobiales bacterium]
MNIFGSLSAKLVAAVLALVGFAFAADLVLSWSIGDRMNRKTEELTGQMRSIVADKDVQIDGLLAELLANKEETQTLTHDISEAETRLASHKKESYLQGARFGISTTVASLISAAMMSGEASTAEDLIETLLESDQIVAINLWRADGTLAFRDNATIDAVNTFTEAEIFEHRSVSEPITISGDRAGVFAKAIENGSTNESLDAEFTNDAGETVPITYAYFPLANGEDCQGCHGASTAPRGVLEVAVPSTELVALKAEAAELVARLDAEREEAGRRLTKSSEAARAAAAEKTRTYTAKLDASRDELATAKSEASWLSMGAKLGFFALTTLILLVVLRNLLARPLAGMREAMHALAKNDLDTEIPSLGRKDEIGDMAAAMQVFKTNAVELRRMESEQEESRQKSEADRRRLMIELADNFEAGVGGIVETVAAAIQRMELSAREMATVLDDTKAQSAHVSAIADQMAGNVESVAAASEEL